MATALFNRHIFGPIHSRRLGLSLGINLLPVDGKLCNYDCIYCECGWGRTLTAQPHLPTREDISKGLRQCLAWMQQAASILDAITFSGNGEPTLHPQFSLILGDVIDIRDRYAPRAKI